jgi:5-deoxy-glucuronate isomerase
VAGFTHTDPSNWTSWPPYEHAKMLEEIYVYFDMPGHRIAFLWAMAAHEEVKDRQFGVVNIQSGFEQNGSGLDVGRK